MRRIPLTDYPRYTQEIELEGVPYRFKFDFNYRGQFYSMTIVDRDNNTLISGVPLCLGIGLIKQYPGRTLPPGDLILIRENGDLTDILDGELGVTVFLLYLTEAEVAAF